MKRLGIALLALSLAVPAAAQQSVFVPATMATVSITGTVAAATKIISGAVGKSIYITALMLTPAATSVVTLTAGTGTNCATNTVNLTGALTPGTVNWGTGNGALLVAPQGDDVCITIATATAPGALAYSQF